MGRTVEKVQGEPAGGKSSLQKKGTLTKDVAEQVTEIDDLLEDSNG